MPRRSGHHNSEENPTPRRTSARIAAVQAASPAKPPTKSPRRKRQSAERHKATSEDTESQQSQVKSESSIEEVNGVDNGSAKDPELTADSQEIPLKKTKVDEKPGDEQSVEPKEKVANHPVNEPPKEEAAPADFEVVEKSDVPAPDSTEVNAAVSAQGEDGNLLVGFVQVDKEELPSATSLEVKQVTPLKEPEQKPADHVTPATITTEDVLMSNSVNGDSHDAPTQKSETKEPVELVQNKIAPVDDAQTAPALAAGDSMPNDIASESIPQ
ncbi:unnamed protein product [Calicophoron daubneyi]|uniref:Uncharacterized protein n=1 Tax=Calicophoron daubneyi TaxID=300641 RepID=A0AAV2TT17_CALDB